MKNKRIVSVILTLAMLLSFLPNVQASAKVKFNSKARTVEVGKTIKVSISGAKKVKWTSSSKYFKIVKKTNKYCTIKGFKEGWGYLTAKADGKNYRCQITVTKPSHKEYVKKFNVDSGVLCDKDGICITLEDVEFADYGVYFNCVIENSNDIDYDISCRYIAVNSIMGSEYESIDVPAGKKGRISVGASYEWLYNNSISNIKTFDILFEGDNSNYDSWEPDKVRLKTSLFDNKLNVKTGKLIYSDGKVDVYDYKRKGNEFTFCLYNKDVNTLIWSMENCSINGWVYDLKYEYDLYAKRVMNDTYTYFTLKVKDDFIKENKISKIDNIEFILDFVYDGKTDIISLNL